MTEPNPALIIIILHYGDIADTRACLASLRPDFPADWQILLIDNGTGTGAATTLHAEFPLIETITLVDNQGWAGGNNVGIAWAQSKRARAVCLLNNDTLAPPTALHAMLDTLDQCGPCLLHPAIDFGDPTEGIQLDPAQDPANHPHPDHPNLYPVDYAYGACLMIPLTIFDSIGVFDERFFLQLEETDFFLRAKTHAIPSLCLNAARIIHFESRSFGARMTPKKLYYIARNKLLLWEKHDRSLRGLSQVLRQLYWQAAKQSATPLRWLISQQPGARAMRAGLIDYSLRRFGSAPGGHNF
ncbi:MAG: glycosyltransferase [Acidocella sp.]|nr:glycosyltransferase [Acidocella sp.]